MTQTRFNNREGRWFSLRLDLNFPTERRVL